MKKNEATSINTKFISKPFPLFITYKNKYLAGVFLSLIATFLYLSSNHFHFFEPKILPFSWLDKNVPFIPQTVWIYISEWLFFLIIYITCNNMLNLNKYVYSFLALQLTSVVIFWIWPTTYPRDLFPLPQDLHPFTYRLFEVLRMTDTPANCCPSLHVSSVYLSSFIFLEEQKNKFPYFFAWGTAIAISTLTTKQHYWIDVVMGFLMATTTYWIFYKNASYRLAFQDSSIIIPDEIE